MLFEENVPNHDEGLSNICNSKNKTQKKSHLQFKNQEIL